MPEEMQSGSMDGMQVAVTGATGFIGSRVVGKLLAKGADVIALGRRKLQDDVAHNPRLSGLELDLENHDLGDLSVQLAGVDCIVHLAAYIPRDQMNPSEADQCLRVNSLGTLKMLLAAEQAKVGRFIHASTGQVYAYSETPVTEGDAVDPSRRATFYLVSKLVAEIYVDYFGRSGHMDTMNLRLGSVYGPGMPMTSTIHRLIEKVVAGRSIQVENDGSYSVDLVYVDDVASLICRGIQSDVTGTYNVGSGTATTFAGLVEEIVRQCPGCSPVLDQVSTSKSPAFSALDFTKARRDFGFEPLSLKEGLARTIELVREMGIVSQSQSRM